MAHRRFATSINLNTEEFWTYAHAGCKKAEQELGDVEVTFRRPASPTARPGRRGS